MEHPLAKAPQAQPEVIEACIDPATGSTAFEESEPPAHDVSDEEDEIDPELEAWEATMRDKAARWLEELTDAETLNNSAVTQLDKAKRRHDEKMREIKSLHESLRQQSFHDRIERARPYFEATATLTEASHQVQESVQEFSASASQYAKAKQDMMQIEARLEGHMANQQSALWRDSMGLNRAEQEELSKATVQMLQNQENRDLQEQAYARALQAYNDAQKQTDIWRNEVGDATIRAVQPFFRQTQHHQQMLEEVSKRIEKLELEVKTAKRRIRTAMEEIDALSIAIHDKRAEFLCRQRQDSSPETERPAGSADIIAEAEGTIYAKLREVDVPRSFGEDAPVPTKTPHISFGIDDAPVPADASDKFASDVWNKFTPFD